MPTRQSEDREDIENIEAWAEVIKDVLWLAPIERRADVLALVTENEEAERKEWEVERNKPGLTFIDLASEGVTKKVPLAPRSCFGGLEDEPG